MRALCRCWPAAVILWVAELVVWGLWNHVGMWSLFALRYLVVAVVAGLGWAQARRLGIARSALVPVFVHALRRVDAISALAQARRAGLID